MPFTGALDSVLEQHRTAREGILEANMNPAAVVKALRAESAPPDGKTPKQRLHVRVMSASLSVSVVPVALGCPGCTACAAIMQEKVVMQNTNTVHVRVVHRD